MYIERTLAATIHEVTRSFPVLLLSGPRQVGKTTLLERCAEPGRRSLSLDRLELRDLAVRDPELFLQTYPPPLLIDEVQYAPQLFGAIKAAVELDRSPGRFWLTGSQKFPMMQGITETLAGRVAILDLLGFSQAELEGRAAAAQPFLPTSAWLEREGPRTGESGRVGEVYRRIWRGSFPALYRDPAPSWELYYGSYLETYLARDVYQVTHVGELTTFLRFLRAVAARTAQLLNLHELARDVDVDPKTAKSWLSVLEALGLVSLLQPYHTNVTKRLVKTPKLYFLDTGLCAYLTRWTSPEALEAGAMSGAMLETYVYTEVLKSYWNRGLRPALWYYRDRDQREVDLVLEQDQTLYPIEIKKTAAPKLEDARPFAGLGRMGHTLGPGAVVCMVREPCPLSAEVLAVPVSWL